MADGRVTGVSRGTVTITAFAEGEGCSDQQCGSATVKVLPNVSGMWEYSENLVIVKGMGEPEELRIYQRAEIEAACGALSACGGPIGGTCPLIPTVCGTCVITGKLEVIQVGSHVHGTFTEQGSCTIDVEGIGGAGAFTGSVTPTSYTYESIVNGERCKESGRINADRPVTVSGEIGCVMRSSINVPDLGSVLIITAVAGTSRGTRVPPDPEE